MSESKKYSTAVTALCVIAMLTIFGVTACNGQTAKQTPDPYGHFRWNGSGYFKTNDYLQAPDKRLFDWSSYTQTWDGKQLTIWGLFALSGVAHGIREAYHAQPNVFEKRNGVAPTSFWGSEAWKRNYQDNNPELPHKKELMGNIGRDVWHTADEFSTWPLVFGVIGTGARNHPLKYRLANGLIGMGARTLFAMLTYNTLRYTR